MLLSRRPLDIPPYPTVADAGETTDISTFTFLLVINRHERSANGKARNILSPLCSNETTRRKPDCSVRLSLLHSYTVFLTQSSSSVSSSAVRGHEGHCAGHTCRPCPLRRMMGCHLSSADPLSPSTDPYSVGNACLLF